MPLFEDKNVLSSKNLTSQQQRHGSSISTSSEDITSYSALSFFPNSFQNKMEAYYCFPMSSIDWSFNSNEAELINAEAYAKGNSIHFAKDKFEPTTSQGQELIAHELAHVYQQASGEVSSGSLQLKGKKINDSCKYEDKADYMAQQAMCQFPSPLEPIEVNSSSNGVVQRKIGVEIEVPIPVDKLTDDDRLFMQEIHALQSSKVSMKPKEFAEKRAQYLSLFETKSPKYDERIYKGKNFIAKADERQKIENLSHSSPPLTMGGAILELVTNPAETPQELLESLLECIQFVSTILQSSSNFTHQIRSGQLLGLQGYNIGPLDFLGSDLTKLPSEININGAIQVNLGVDFRQFDHLAEWYALSSQHKPLQNGEGYSGKIAQHLIEAVIIGRRLQAQYSQAFPFTGSTNGIKGILTLLSLYLIRGREEETLGSTIKNVTPLFNRSPFDQLLHSTLSKEELSYFQANFEQIKRDLLVQTGRLQGEEKIESILDELLFKAKKPDGSFHTNYQVEDLFSAFTKPNEILLTARTFSTEEVGPLRSTTSSQRELGATNRAKGGVIEFRNIPELPIDQWIPTILSFFQTGQVLNQIEE